jgi:hypothetical protein
MPEKAMKARTLEIAPALVVKTTGKECQAMPWTLETQYTSAERKMTMGYLALYDGAGEYIGRVADRADIVEAFKKCGLVSKVSMEA